VHVSNIFLVNIIVYILELFKVVHVFKTLLVISSVCIQDLSNNKCGGTTNVLISIVLGCILSCCLLFKKKNKVVFHISSSWVKIRLQTEDKLPRLPRTAQIVMGCGGGLVSWCADMQKPPSSASGSFQKIGGNI
jgi:hypothetical protein